ncbi:MAG: hypothetical protein IPK19_24600 [Chloroflexi bacterium]|nr:hypothetical protein [Chloroflexota bacterium]
MITVSNWSCLPPVENAQMAGFEVERPPLISPRDIRLWQIQIASDRRLSPALLPIITTTI